MCVLKTSVTGIITFFIFISYIYPQTDYVYPATEKYRFRHLTTDDGLPVSYCIQVLKDSHGFIWISTRAGLCRYDGYNMKVYQYDPLDSTSISDNRISLHHGMEEDTNGYLWIGTANGLNRYDPVTDAFKRYQHDPKKPGSLKGDRIYCIFLDHTGNLWIGTGDQQMGLNRYLPDKDQFISYSLHSGNPDLNIHCVLSVYEDISGVLWVGTSDGLYQFDRKNEMFRMIPYTPKESVLVNPLSINNIGEDIDGTLFIATPFGYLTFGKKRNELVPFDLLYDERENYYELNVLPDPADHNILWMIGYGLYQFNKQEHSLAQIPYDPVGSAGVKGELISSIFFDETNMLWIPNERGITLMDPYRNQIESHPEFSKKYHRSNSFMEDSQGNFWIGTFDVVCFDKDMNLVKEYRLPDSKEYGFPIKIVVSLLEDTDNNIWIGTESNGLYLLAKGQNKIVRYTLPEPNIFIIPDMIEDSRGNVWFATNSGLFQRKNGMDSESRFYPDSVWRKLTTSYILDLYEDRAENLWIGTQFNGLFCQPPEYRLTGKFIHFAHDPFDTASISNNSVWSVYQDCFNNLWIATEDGLNKYIPEKNQFRRYYNTADMGSNFIYDLTGDDKGNLWMVTESGLFRFSGTSGNTNDEMTPLFTQFISFSNIFPYKIYKNKTGKIFVGTALDSGKGFFSFDPDEIIDNAFIPPVVITDLTVRNTSLKPDTIITLKKHVVLKHNQNFFTLECAALDFLDPSKNRYAHYLEGLEDDWIYTGNNRLASYTKVPPGNYIFHVRGSNSDGYWNKAGTSMMITILPPPWKTWWAYVLYVVFVFFIGYLIIRFFLKRLQLSRRLEIEHVEAEKLKELDRLKSRFFANISHEFRTPLTLILGPLEKVLASVSGEVKNNLVIMQRNASRLQQLINELLSLSKLESGQMKLHAVKLDLVKAVNGYVQSFESLATQRKIDLVFNSEKDDIQAYIDQEKLEKILFNLLSNAFKFTGEGGEIVVSVGSWQSTRLHCVTDGQAVDGEQTEDWRLKTGDLAGQWVSITISDTGRGIPPDKLPHIFNRFYQADDSVSRAHEGTGIGLALAKELVELHHGTISVVSAEGKGTTFTVLLPLGKEHLKEEEILSKEKSAGDIDHFDEELIVDETTGNRPERLQANLRHDDSKPIILVVEDNSDLREYIRDSLGESFQVLESQNGKEGLKKAFETVPDLIISDVMMPKMDGFELCKKLKTDERTSHIPVILLTARAGKESRIEGLETGADDFITKPFDVKELLARIKNLLELRQKLRERFLKDAEKIGLFTLKDLSEAGISSMEQKFLQKAIGIVNINLSDPEFTVKKYCAEMAMSNMQLHRKLVAVTGQTANRFIRTYRLNHAARLLEKRAGNVTEVAYEVGFSNLSWFARCFQEQFGMPPSEYPSKPGYL